MKDEMELALKRELEMDELDAQAYIAAKRFLMGIVNGTISGMDPAFEQKLKAAQLLLIAMPAPETL